MVILTALNRLNLGSKRYKVIDENPNSKYFQVFGLTDKVYGIGKHSFILYGSPYLIKGTDIIIEILDIEGQPIVCRGVQDDKSLPGWRVWFKVTKAHTSGIATISIAGSVAGLGDTIGGNPNAIWQKTISINTELANNSDIIFKETPSFTVTETISTDLDKDLKYRSYANFYLTDMETYSGQVNSVNVYCLSTGSISSSVNPWKLLTKKSIPATAGINDNSYSFKTQINTERERDYISFYTEYLNTLDEPAKTVSGYVYTASVIDTLFEGAQDYILSGAFVGDGFVTGSIFLSNTRHSGIKMAGTNSGYILSVGYDGFLSASLGLTGPGFLIYSGSVLPSSGDGYTGVGIELVANSSSYLRYSTNPDRFEVVTKTVFLGTTGSAFVSCSDGYLQIYSANFRIDKNGNVYISGSISASEGYIGGWQILSDRLQSTNNNMILSGSGVISSSNFYVSEAGNLTASNAWFKGIISSSEGNIGGWTISNGKLVSNNNNMMLSSSGVISSSYFYVDEFGNLSASSGWFVGTVTASRVVTGDGIISNWILSPEYLSDANDKIKLQPAGPYIISSSQFQVDINGGLTASNAIIKGNIQADSGYIGNWILDAGRLSGSYITMDATDSRIFKTDDNNDATGYYIDFTPGAGDKYYVRFGPNFAVSSSGILIASGAIIEGVLTASAGYIGGWKIETDRLISDGSPYVTMISNTTENLAISAGAVSYHLTGSAPFIVTHAGAITGSQVLFTGGKIGGWTIGNNLSSTGITLVPSDAIELGTATAYDTGNGIWLGNDGAARFGNAAASRLQWNLTNIEIYNSTNEKIISFGNTNTIAGWSITTSSISKNSVCIDAETEKIYVSNSGYVVAIGKYDGSNYGIYANDGSNTLFEMGTNGNTIANWTISSGSLRSPSDEIILDSTNKKIVVGNNIVIDGANKSISSNGYQSGIKGFNITPEYAEFGNVSVRGEIHSAVFTKDIINAVNGYLMIANSSILSESIDDAQTYILVNDNVFKDNDILRFKDETNSEYLLITGSINTGSAPYKFDVTRDYDGTGANVWSSGSAVVSTAQSGSGYILLDASSNYSPFMDIIIRTGSGWNDIETRARLGSLAGITDLDVGLSAGNNQYGLYSDNVYLRGGIVAKTGSIGGWEITTEDIHSSGRTNNSGITLRSDYIGLSGSGATLYLGATTDYIKWNGSNLYINLSNFELSSNNIDISSINASMSLGEGKIVLQGDATNPYISINQATKGYDQTGEFIGYDSGVGKFSLKTDTTKYFLYDGTDLFFKSPRFVLNSDTGFLSISGSITASNGIFEGYMIAGESKIGKDVGGVGSSGLYLNATNYAYDTGNYRWGDATNYFSSSGKLVSTNFELSGSTTLRIGTDKIALGTNADEITLSAGTGFYTNVSGHFKVGSTTEYITWDGSNLNILTDNIFLSGSNVQIITENFLLGNNQNYISGSDNGLTIQTSNAIISGSSVIIDTPIFFLGDTGSAYISGSDGKLEINSTNFTLDNAGNIYISGIISASEGNIGGWQILSDKLQSTNNNMMLSSSGVISASNFYISEAGNLTASNANFQGIISSSEGNIGGFTINSTQINDEGNNLILKSNGQITASNAQISGSIVADNLTINNDILLGHNLDVAAGGSITNDNVTIDDSGIQINSGSITLGSNFHVDLLGNLTASNAQFSGSIIVQSGKIGKWNIGNDSIYSGSIYLGGGLSWYTLDAFGITLDGGEVVDTGYNYWIRTEDNDYLFNVGSSSKYINWDGSNLSWKGNNTELTSDGQFTASQAKITGDINCNNITANSGSISGWVLSDDYLTGVGGSIKTAASGQRVVINGADNTLKFYKQGLDNPIIIIDDNTFGGEPGIKILSGSIYIYEIYIDNNSFIGRGYIKTKLNFIDDLMGRAIWATISDPSDYTYAQKRIAVYADANVDNEANTSIPIGIYGSAVTANSAISAWAGYFDNGDVLIKNYLRVGGLADNITEAFGIKFGSSEDTNLYRSAANVLKTDDSLHVGTNLIVTGSIVVGDYLVSRCIAGSTVRNSHDAETNTAEGSYTKLKTITFSNGFIGQFRCTWQMKILVYGTGYAKLYKNGVAIDGTENTTTNTSYEAKTEDVTLDFDSTDTLELWAYTTDSPVYVKELRLSYDYNPTVPSSNS